MKLLFATFTMKDQFKFLILTQIQTSEGVNRPKNTITRLYNPSLCPLVCWMIINNDVLYEFHWLFELKSRSSKIGQHL